MAPIKGRVAKPERQWGCLRGTPKDKARKDDTTLKITDDY